MNDRKNSDWRYEFRLFGPDLATISEALGEMRSEGDTREKNLYLLGMTPPAINLKVRDGRLESKQLVDVTDDGLEQWRPGDGMDFPLPAGWCRQRFGVEGRSPLSLAELLHRTCRPHGRGIAMHVLKSRRRFSQDELLAESCRLIVNGARIDTIAIESANVGKVARWRSKLQLDDETNTSYPTALARMAGLEPLPDTSPWRAVSPNADGSA